MTEDKEKKPKGSPQRQAAMRDLAAGAKFMVTKTNEEHRKDIIEITGGGAIHSDGVTERLFYALKNEGRLSVVDEGLFPGCGQCFSLVR
jgi:hypothetical protein